MSSTDIDIFAALSEKQGQPTEMIAQMVDHYRSTKQPMELFEALKMRIRNELGLPLVASEDEPSRPEDVERQLENGLLDACREAGTMLIKSGKVADGWMYLRPTGDSSLAKELLSDVEIGEDNYDEMIQVLLHEGVDIARGYQAVIDNQGTCNSITLFEQSLANRNKTDRQAAAACLLDHLYDELVSLVRDDITSRDKAPADDENLADMIQNRKWVLEDGGYHLDTTHLSSTVRIASVLDKPEQIQKLWELTQYGRKLNHQFQYPGEEPFVDFYPAYSNFFSILLGQNVDAGLKFFERRAKAVDCAEHGTAAVETYVDLLDRVGRHKEAVEAAIELVPQELPPQRIVSLLIDIATRAKLNGDASAFEPIIAFCQQKGDILSYVAALHAAGQ